MAIYHASIKSFSRGKGESSLAAAAYRAGIDLIDTKTRAWHRYSQRKGVAEHHMLVPTGAPEWCCDAKVFWDANEAWETRANARVARELEVSLPDELDAPQRKKLALELGQLLVNRYQAVVLVAIHEPSGRGDQRNHHVHLLMSARQVGPNGIGERAGAEFDARSGRGAEEIRVVRELVSATINAHLTQAGVQQKVDHRSLKDQARAAAVAGDIKSAIRLTRPPTKHIGRVVTALQRRGVELGGTSTSCERAMDQAIAIATGAGTLIDTTPGHSHSAARIDRAIAQDRANPDVGSGAPSTVRTMRLPGISGPSTAALHLSRVGRIAHAQGRDAEVLKIEAELIEEWLASQIAIAEATLQSVRQIPGVQLEPEFVEALDTLCCHRVSVHGTKPFLFEDSEELAFMIENYVAELCRPHQARERLRIARAHLSEIEDEGASLELARARRRLWKAKAGVSSAARIKGERRLRKARLEMIQARDKIERDFYIDLTPAEPGDTGDLDIQPEDGASGSDLNKRELKPRPRPRM